MKQVILLFFMLSALCEAVAQDTLKPLLRKEVFDFQVGDVMQYEYLTRDYTVGGVKQYTYSQVTTLGKTVIGDTIIYYNEVKEKSFLGNIEINYISEVILHKDSSIFYGLPNYISDSLKVKYKYIEQNTIDDDAYKWYGEDSIMCKNSVFPTMVDSEKWLTYDRWYKKGIGQVYQFYNDYAHPIDWQGQIYVTELIYYKKGNKIYGKPMEFITAISDNIVSDIKVYPNPTNDVIYLQGLSEDANDIAYKIYDTFGRIAQSGSISIQNSIDVTTLARGVYILSLSYANESKSSLEKIIIY